MRPTCGLEAAVPAGNRRVVTCHVAGAEAGGVFDGDGLELGAGPADDGPRPLSLEVGVSAAEIDWAPVDDAGLRVADGLTLADGVGDVARIGAVLAVDRGEFADGGCVTAPHPANKRLPTTTPDATTKC